MAYGFNDDKSKAQLANVAKSGSYNDLSDKPTIPSAVQVIDNLTSTSGSAALSANQGRVLKSYSEIKSLTSFGAYINGTDIRIPISALTNAHRKIIKIELEALVDWNSYSWTGNQTNVTNYSHTNDPCVVTMFGPVNSVNNLGWWIESKDKLPILKSGMRGLFVYTNGECALSSPEIMRMASWGGPPSFDFASGNFTSLQSQTMYYMEV